MSGRQSCMQARYCLLVLLVQTHGVRVPDPDCLPSWDATWASLDGW